MAAGLLQHGWAQRGSSFISVGHWWPLDEGGVMLLARPTPYDQSCKHLQLLLNFKTRIKVFSTYRKWFRGSSNRWYLLALGKSVLIFSVNQLYISICKLWPQHRQWLVSGSSCWPSLAAKSCRATHKPPRGGANDFII